MIYDVAIVGAGPAGLSAALLLARCRRRIVVFDNGRPRNFAAQVVNGFLGLDSITPEELRAAGRRQVAAYGVTFVDSEVIGANCSAEGNAGFEIAIIGTAFRARKLLLATGVRDSLPEIENIAELYGKSVHHCPYCDGWEHRDERLVALGDGDEVAGLALSLRTWSSNVTACSNGSSVSQKMSDRLTRHGISIREEAVIRLDHSDGRLKSMTFAAGPCYECDAVFFHSSKVQHSPLPAALGCNFDRHGLIRTEGKQGTGIPGLFLAGDADGDVQFAIVAAAEGATAATAINRELQDEDCQ